MCMHVHAYYENDSVTVLLNVNIAEANPKVEYKTDR
jgi:hypothetical protein